MSVRLSITGVDRSEVIDVEVGPLGVFENVNNELWWFENHQDDRVCEAQFTHRGVTYLRIGNGPWRTKEEVEHEEVK